MDKKEETPRMKCFDKYDEKKSEIWMKNCSWLFIIFAIMIRPTTFGFFFYAFYDWNFLWFIPGIIGFYLCAATAPPGLCDPKLDLRD